MKKFYSLESTYEGEISENTDYGALGCCGRDKLREPEEKEMIPLPYGSEIHFLPGRDPIGIRKGKRESWFKSGDEKVCAVACVTPPGYTRTMLPAYHVNKAGDFPFFGYTMGAFHEGELWIAAVQTDSSLRWDPSQYNSPDLETKIKKKLKKFKNNRLLPHIAKCALEYGCWNAQNIFYERWEGGIPVSVGCNADCLGCISKKRKSKVQSPQSRIKFVPTPDEICEIAIPHLQMGRAIISFGQGCEGEPLTQCDVIAESIRRMRAETDSGTIHINTNGAETHRAVKVIEAGLDSIRVSMNSAVRDTYNSYFSLGAGTFEGAKETVKAAKEHGLFVSINYLVMPGVNDNEYEAEAFIKFLQEYRPDMVQTRNLNIDPEMYFRTMPTLKGKAIGIYNLIERIREACPGIIIGNFNRAVRD